MQRAAVTKGPTTESRICKDLMGRDKLPRHRVHSSLHEQTWKTLRHYLRIQMGRRIQGHSGRQANLGESNKPASRMGKATNELLHRGHKVRARPSLLNIKQYKTRDKCTFKAKKNIRMLHHSSTADSPRECIRRRPRPGRTIPRGEALI